MVNKNPIIHREISLEAFLNSDAGRRMTEDLNKAFEEKRVKEAKGMFDYLEKHPYPLLIRAYSLR